MGKEATHAARFAQGAKSDVSCYLLMILKEKLFFV